MIRFQPRLALWFLRLSAGVSLVLIVHNYCWSILPQVAMPLTPAAMRPVAGTHAFTYPFLHSPGDTQTNPRSRSVLAEDGVPLGVKFRVPQGVLTNGGGSWCHSPGILTFSSIDDSDPRTNGHRYVVFSPILYSRTVGYAALGVFAAAAWGLGRRRKSTDAAKLVRPAADTPRHFRMHLFAGLTVFLASLYFSTGTLAPYANTLRATVQHGTDYLFNIDHPFHRTLYDFVQGQPRETWENSLLLRRILHAAMARPWMNVLGYEVGGVVFNTVLNLLGFVLGVAMVLRHVGGRGAVLAIWLLALYPGAAYWVGQPYAYAVIFPLGLAAFWILLELPSARPVRLVTLSLALGVIYLSYDFHAYFLPASVFVLLWKRRFIAAASSVALQVLPLAIWLWVLKHVVHVPLENSNSSLYRVSLMAYFDPSILLGAGDRLVALPEITADIFLGSNFFFLPLLAAVAWSLDFSWAAFTKHRAVVAMLAIAAALLVFFNFPPPHEGAWNLSGSWISRIYQPIFPALVFSLAQWWQERLPIDVPARLSRLTLVLVTLLGNALVSFGPALNNPLRLSERAFYRFYDHTDAHWAYRYNLEHYGRRPLGFPRASNSRR